MSDDWSKLRDVDPLADGRAELEFAIPLAEFPRLGGQLAHTQGEARGRVRFARESGLPVADVELSATVPLVCQRCLEPMSWVVEGTGHVGLVADAESADRAPKDLETVLAPEGRITVRDLVEEELLLSLPIVPSHADPGECGVQTARRPAGDADAAPGTTQRPFERLGELLKRDD